MQNKPNFLTSHPKNEGQRKKQTQTNPICRTKDTRPNPSNQDTLYLRTLTALKGALHYWLELVLFLLALLCYLVFFLKPILVNIARNIRNKLFLLSSLLELMKGMEKWNR